MVKKYLIKGLDCPSCAKILELDLGDIGIKAKCDFAKSILELEYNEKQIKEKQIIEILKKNNLELEE